MIEWNKKNMMDKGNLWIANLAVNQISNQNILI